MHLAEKSGCCCPRVHAEVRSDRRLCQKALTGSLIKLMLIKEEIPGCSPFQVLQGQGNIKYPDARDAKIRVSTLRLLHVHIHYTI